MTDSISEGSLFGGVGTAIIFSVLLAEKLDCPLRIITRTQQPEPGNVRDVLIANHVAWKKNIEFLFAPVDTDQANIDLAHDDIFVTTSWWTTWSILESIPANRIIYLLQEDERMFYPQGDERLRCQNLMSNSEIKIIVNSYLLYRHLVLEGFANIADRASWFEPSIIGAKDEKTSASETTIKRNLFFYARPGVNIRNLFCLGLEVIENALVEGILDTDAWTIFFVGKDLFRMKLNGSIEPVLVQNIKWSDYRKLVNSMDLGLSLMWTPHPSYPPLDLAAAGAVVVTNTFGVKTSLELYSDNIICGPPTVAGLTDALRRALPLVFDPLLRKRNRVADHILRDWRTSFSEPLNHISSELCNNS